MSIVQVNRDFITDTIEEILKSEGGLETGYKALDERINGLQNGSLYILGGRPAMGKTTFALNIAYHLATKQNKKVLYVSYDMSQRRMLARLLQMDCGINLEHLQRQALSELQMQKISKSVSCLGQTSLLLEDATGFTIEDLRQNLKETTILEGTDLVLIDYLQLMPCSKDLPTRQEEISYMCLQLKTLAKELNIPILALSALSRALEQRPDHRPMLSDLRESGAIEQFADVVMLLYRDDYYTSESNIKGITEVIVSKNAYGPTGSEELIFLEDRRLYNGLKKRTGK